MKNEKFIEEGCFELSKIEEEGRFLEFSPPLEINYDVYSLEKDDGEKCTVAYIQYDFGMEDEMRIDNEGNWLCHGYNGLNVLSTNEERVRKNVEFDLFHAFFHYTGDPNYSKIHWALVGWLKNRTNVIENE